MQIVVHVAPANELQFHRFTCHARAEQSQGRNERDGSPAQCADPLRQPRSTKERMNEVDLSILVRSIAEGLRFGGMQGCVSTNRSSPMTDQALPRSSGFGKPMRGEDSPERGLCTMRSAPDAPNTAWIPGNEVHT
jgi:hypothetical protein